MNVRDIATTLDAAAASATATTQISATQNFSEKQAYEIQQLSLEKRYAHGEKYVGMKLGFTSFAKMKQMGVHDMIWGRLTDAMWYKSGDQLPLAQFIHPRAEPEIAFLIKKDITREITLEEIPEYILACAPAIEVIDSRYQNFKFSLEDVIADNCSSAAFCIGAWQPLPSSLNDLEVSLAFGSQVMQNDQSNAILDNPYLSVCNASRLAQKYGEQLLAGHVILAGAATPAEFIPASTKITAKVQTLGNCALTSV